MLQLITGRSGAGKTHRLFADMHTLLTNDPAARLYLLVPEQASYENEKQLLTRFGDTLSQRVQVISFTRMADTVFRSIGGIAGRRMDATVSLLLMNRALAEVSDHLTLYRRHGDNGDPLQGLLSILSECKQCAVSPALLSQTALSLPKGILRTKTEELSLIFSAYDALAAQAALIDPQDDLTVLAKRLPECSLFDNTYWFIDGFKGFTGQEFAVLKTLLPRVARMTVTLCSDGIRADTDPAADRFFIANRTGNRLREMAYAAGVTVAKICHLTDNRRTGDKALQALEAGCYTAAAPVYDESAPAVQITPCADRAEECRYAARTIRRLLREQGGHCRDFTVVVRDLEAYGGMLETAFEREGLPCYTDKRDSILTQPLTTLMESALAVIVGGWDSADLLRLCKTGLVGFSALSTARLENYAFTWQLRGKAWQQPFENHPDGLGAAMDEAATHRLTHLNCLRKRLVEPLARLGTRLSGNRNGQEFAAALFQLLQELHVPRMIRFQAARLTACGEYAMAEQYGRLWDCLIDILDKFALALGTVTLPLKQLADLFHLAVSEVDLGVLPQTLDSVQIGCADRIRYTAPKTVLILGANEGVFPAYPVGGGMFTDRERRQLIRAGLPMADDADHQAAEERYYAYMAVAAPSEQLIVTYAQESGSEALLPSSLVETIRQILPHHTRNCALCPDNTDTESKADAFERMTALWNENSSRAATLRRVFCDDPVYAPRMAALERTAAHFAFEEPATARRLFGEHLRLYPTQVETYYRCRFAYFCEYGIRIRPRKKAELNAAQAGSLAHYVMQTTLPVYVAQQWENCDSARILRDTEAAVNRYVEEQFGGLDDKSGRFANLIRQLTRLSAALLWRVVQELRESQFIPVDHELPIGRFDVEGNGVPPWILTTPDGTSIQVRGTVDRVDVLHRDGCAYVRIVDYKTGHKEFDLSEVLEGLNLQMLIYLFSICQGGQNRYGTTVPAGVLYLPAQLPVIKVDRNLAPEEMEKKRLATMRMNGLLLDDPEILKAMEADLGGVFIPAKMTAKGELSAASSLATLSQFGRLQQRIARLLTDMVQTLHRGDIAALPVGGTQDGCRYCDYHDICGHEETDPVRSLEKRSLAEALQDLEADDKEGEQHE